MLKLGRVLSVAFAAMFWAVASSPSYASQSTGGKILNVEATPESVVFIYASGTGRVLPPCANAALPMRWAFAINSDRGKAMLSVVLTARAQNQTVTITGTGSCTPGWSGGDLENVAWVSTNG